MIPFALALVVLGAKFQGLRIDLALEHAQVARRVAAGEGLSTDSIRPLSLAFSSDLKRHPDLYHAPLHPLILGFAYSLLHPSDRLTGALGLLFWVVSVFLTFFLARRWFGTGVAVLATAFYGCNVVMIKSALFGLPYPLCAVFVLLGAWLTAPQLQDEDAAPASSKGRSALRMAAAGAACGLAAMSHYLLFFLAPAVGVYLVVSRRRKERALLLFGLGFLVVLLPWMLRNFHWGRNPLFSLYWYEALAGTASYPGDSVWRSMTATTMGPLEFVFLHPIQVARKAMGGLVRFWQESLQVVDPVVAFLFVAALVGARTAPRWRGWFLSVSAGALLCVGSSILLRVEPEILLAWTPLLAIAAAAHLVGWLTEALERTSIRRLWRNPVIQVFFQRSRRVRGGVRFVASLAVLMAVGFPLFHYLWIFRVEPYGMTQDAAVLRQQVPEQGTVMTDQPAFVAWYGQRRAVWLCSDETVWDAIVDRGGAIDATYVTPAVTGLLNAERGGWWWWITSPRGVYRDLAPVDPMPPRGVLRVRGKGRG
jgi:4-amino-4-deoxy-L-arabinose transferase-like glycosyltransferase